MSNIISQTARKLRPLKKWLEDKVEEAKFRSEYQKVLHKKNINQEEKSIRLQLEDKSIKIFTPDLKDFISFHIAKSDDFFDRKDLDQIQKFIPPNATVIDAGANIGNHSLYYALIGKAKKIYSFEPQKKIFDILKLNIEKNHLSEIIEPFHLGLGDKKTRAGVKFRDDIPISSDQSLVNHGGLFLSESESGEFEIDTLDNQLSNRLEELHFIKMDVQGFEEKVLIGGKTIIKKFRPLLQIECMDKKELNDRIIPLMSQLNYKVKFILDLDYLFEPIL